MVSFNWGKNMKDWASKNKEDTAKKSAVVVGLISSIVAWCLMLGSVWLIVKLV